MTSEPFSLTALNPSREIPASGAERGRTTVAFFRFPSVPPVQLSRRGLLLAGLVAGLVGFAQPAAADFRLCNNTGSRVGIAIGYEDKEGWTTEGWWNLSPRSCDTLLRGTLVARFYYIYALDYERGGEWSGRAFMCTREKEFTIRGIKNCLARGYDRTGFFEIDTGEQRSWTVQLTDSSEQTSLSAPATAPPAAAKQSPIGKSPASESKGR